MTTDEISQELQRKITEIILAGLNNPDPAFLQNALNRASRHAMAGWVLMEATDEQIKQVYEQFRPAQDRN